MKVFVCVTDAQSFQRTGWPFCCADLDSRRLNTSPPTEHSRHTPQSAKPPQNWPFGCIMRTPFVVRPSISTLSCHLVAFSYEFIPKQINDCADRTDRNAKNRCGSNLRPRKCSDSNRNQLHKCWPRVSHFVSLKFDRRNVKLCSASLWHLFCRRAAYPWPQNRWAIRMNDRSVKRENCIQLQRTHCDGVSVEIMNKYLPETYPCWCLLCIRR